MSEPKWTPGPWAACSRQGDYWDSVVYLPRDSNLEICQCFHGKWTAGKDRCEANAHLIAAAPELYEALKEQLECITAGPCQLPMIDPVPMFGVQEPQGECRSRESPR